MIVIAALLFCSGIDVLWSKKQWEECLLFKFSLRIFTTAVRL
jgi:hypothetical protein